MCVGNSLLDRNGPDSDSWYHVKLRYGYYAHIKRYRKDFGATSALTQFGHLGFLIIQDF